MGLEASHWGKETLGFSTPTESPDLPIGGRLDARIRYGLAGVGEIIPVSAGYCCALIEDEGVAFSAAKLAGDWINLRAITPKVMGESGA